MTSTRGVLLALATFALLFALPGCQSPTGGPDSADADTTLRSVLVAPLNLTIRPSGGFEADPEPVWQALIAHLGSLDLEYSLLDKDRSEELWAEVMAEPLERGGGSGLRMAWARFARRAVEVAEREGSAGSRAWVLLPSVILRSAPVRGRDVSWDGVHRDLQIPFALDRAASSAMGVASGLALLGYRGQLAAASLHVALLTPGGQVVWEGLGGLDVVQEIDSRASAELDSWRFRQRAQPFDQSEHIREGVALAFVRRLPGSARLAGSDVAIAERLQGAPPASVP